MQSFKQGVTIFAAFLLVVPCWGSSSVVGTVQNSNDVLVRGAAAVPGTTVYNNDKLEVGPRGNVVIALSGGGQVQLLANSAASISKPGNEQALQLTVERGIARFRSTGQSPVEAVLGDATIRTAQGPDGGGYVSVVSRHSAVIGAEKGALLVTTDHNGSTITVPEGSAVTVSVESDSVPAQTEVKKSNRGLIILIGALVIGGVVAAAVAASQSEPGPNKGAVAPFKP